MKSLSMMILALVAMMSLAVACGSDSGGTTPDKGGTTTDTPVTTDVPVVEDTPVVTDTPVATDTPVVTDTTVVTDTPVTTDVPVVEDTPVSTDTVVATGACQNAADLAIIAPDREAISAAAKTCGMGCLGDADPVACSTPCVVEKTGITSACAGCYAAMINCTIKNCVAECVADPNAQVCLDCQETKGCFKGFYECSGFVPEA
jgi:hypothetical protein